MADKSYDVVNAPEAPSNGGVITSEKATNAKTVQAKNFKGQIK
jgi:hypothetical protein